MTTPDELEAELAEIVYLHRRLQDSLARLEGAGARLGVAAMRDLAQQIAIQSAQIRYGVTHPKEEK